MFSQKRAKNFKDVRRWYDLVYKEVGFQGTESFNHMILDLLRVSAGDIFLDVGCGGGGILKFAEARGAKTYGIDISRVAIKKASKISPSSALHASPAEKLPFPDKYFDAIACVGSLEHFIDMDKSLSEMRRVLKDDGRVLIHVPNLFYIVYIVYVGLSGWVPTHCQINERFTTRKGWEKILEKYFLIERCTKYNTRRYLKWVPINFSCAFNFLCKKKLQR